MTTAIAKVLEIARRKLLDTGTRNRLVHVNRSNQRANCLNVVNERSGDIYKTLRLDGKRMRFKATGKDRTNSDNEILLAMSDTKSSNQPDRHNDNFLETPLGSEALAHRLLRLAHDARTAEEEQGLNLLYLAVGFLRWREDKNSEIWREAPLLLLPVNLVRNDRTSTYDLLCRDDHITANLPLQERLRQDYGISLPEIEETEEWKPSDYFDAVSKAVAGQTDWSVDEDGMQLGFFSFAKLLMHRDLDTEAWPKEAFLDHPILKGLLVDGFEADKPLFNDSDKLDALLDPAHLIQVIDADASQTKVIEEVRRGSSLVVQGPPGTGKSQTITNIIAAAAHDGKSVLFIAEKMAALTVVHDRLVKSGLKDICLELHSRTANKKSFAEELGRTLSNSASTVPPAEDPAGLRKTRDQLNKITDLLHTNLNQSGDTPFSTIAEIVHFIGQDISPPRISLDGLHLIGREKREIASRHIESFLIALAKTGDPKKHYFKGTRILDLQPTDLARLANELTAAILSIDGLLAQANNIAKALHQPTARTLSEIEALALSLDKLAEKPADASNYIDAVFEEASNPRMLEGLEAGRAWLMGYEPIAQQFNQAAWTANVALVRADIASGQYSLFARLFGRYRRSSRELGLLLTGPLPKAPADRLALVDQLIAVQALRNLLADEEPWLRTALGQEWRGEKTPFMALKTTCQWIANIKASGSFKSAWDLKNALSSLQDPSRIAASLLDLVKTCRTDTKAPLLRLDLDLSQTAIEPNIEISPLIDFRILFNQMASNPGGYHDWATLIQNIDLAKQHGASTIISAVSEGKLKPASAKSEFNYACAEARWNAAITTYPELKELNGTDRHQIVERFKEQEKSRIETTKNLILSRHFNQLPRGAVGEMGVIRGEIGRRRGRKSIRWIFDNAGKMIQRIKPVMLMSPISVAQFLPPGSLTFDLLVIDEASQIRPEDALGVIARARQIVVVGDQKQLPPSSFFDRLLSDDPEPDYDEDNETMPVGATAADMESILKLCDAKGLRSRMLEWHYRSRDPSLIQISNIEFYEDRLVLPPSPLQLDENNGLTFKRVAGVYARSGTGVGRKGTNKIEAEAIVKAIANHARHSPDLSLGVVTFSKTQSDMMTEIMELERRRDTVLDAFLREGRHEDVFVKNIENVQGDERDVIMISVGYGPQEPNGLLNYMNFGPVNGEGGERRLNVLFTRARVRCEVYASFDPGDIDLSRTTKEGPKILKRFLDFAKTRQIDDRTITGLEADSPFEEDVSAVIRQLGYLADPQVGTAGFRLDIGVRHPKRPGEYLLAVECDGASYHSALWARERDRLRQEILEGMGWNFHRIWSTDWFYHRDREIKRLSLRLEQAKKTKTGNQQRGANTAIKAPDTPLPLIEDQPVEIDHISFDVPPYIRSNLSINPAIEPHDIPLTKLAELIQKIIEVEGPIHIDEIARRISSACGKVKVGSRIMKVTVEAARHAVRTNTTLRELGSFYLTAEQNKNPPVRSRNQETGSLLKAIYLPPMEIVAAAELIRAESGEIEPGELVTAITRLFGFKRVGNELSEVIESALDGKVNR